jgi:hypothetical protein
VRQTYHGGVALLKDSQITLPVVNHTEEKVAGGTSVQEVRGTDKKRIPYLPAALDEFKDRDEQSTLETTNRLAFKNFPTTDSHNITCH